MSGGVGFGGVGGCAGVVAGVGGSIGVGGVGCVVSGGGGFRGAIGGGDSGGFILGIVDEDGSSGGVGGVAIGGLVFSVGGELKEGDVTILAGGGDDGYRTVVVE